MSKAVPRRANLNSTSGLSTTRMISKQTGSKMSGAHGTNSGDKSKGLTSSGGSGRIGQNCKGFSSGIRKPGGPKELS